MAHAAECHGGHRLRLQLGAPRPGGDRWLYYINHEQTVSLDRNGWQEVSLDIDRFATPRDGLRCRDLRAIVFVEFFVTAGDPDVELDIAIDRIRFTGPTPADRAAAARREQQRRTTLTQLRPRLDAVRRQIDDTKPTDATPLHRAALQWCANDIERCLRAEELEIVAQGERLLDDLQREVADSKVFRVNLTADHNRQHTDNPFGQSLTDAARPMCRHAASWPKGRAGYRAFPRAWTMRRMAYQLHAAAWCLTTPDCPLRHDTTLLHSALSRLDLIAHQHTRGDFNIDRLADRGYDGNINRFCLAPALDAWWRLRRAYPDLLPPAKQRDIQRGLHRLVEFQVNNYGKRRLAASDDHAGVKPYPNMDAHYLLIVTLAERLLPDDPSWRATLRRHRDAFLALMERAVYPDGGFAYAGRQNECIAYHHLNVAYLARYWQLTGDHRAKDLLRRTLPYYPLSIEPAGIAESYTDAAWKHYWNPPEASGPGVLTGLFRDGRHKWIAQACGRRFGYGDDHAAAIAADCWRSSAPIAPIAPPDNYVRHDRNIQGPRGRFGRWSFAINGRDYGPGEMGKDTFLGCMVAEPDVSEAPLGGALQLVGVGVRTPGTASDIAWHAADERLSTRISRRRATLGVTYRLSHFATAGKPGEPMPWRGVQQWWLDEQRAVGLVEIQPDDDAHCVEKRPNQSTDSEYCFGRICLGMYSELQRLGPSRFRYGDLLITLHAHNFARIETSPADPWPDCPPERARGRQILLRDGEPPAGSSCPRRRFFLVEVRPIDAPALDDAWVSVVGPLRAVTIVEPQRRHLLLHNPTDRPWRGSMQSLLTKAQRPGAARLCSTHCVTEVDDGPVQLGPNEHVAFTRPRRSRPDKTRELASSNRAPSDG